MNVERSILVVDDEEQIRNMCAKFFRREGFDIRAVASGEEALEVMRERPCRVLIIDMELPNMSGLDLGHAVRREWPLSLTIAVTGFGSLFHLVDCREAGFEDYFLKPVDMAGLLRAVERSFAKLDRWLVLPRG